MAKLNGFVFDISATKQLDAKVIGCKAPKVNKSFKGDITLPADLAAWMDVIGEEACQNAIEDWFVIRIQGGLIRPMLEAGQSNEAIQAAIDNYRGTGFSDGGKAVKAQVAALSQDRKALLEQMAGFIKQGLITIDQVAAENRDMVSELLK